MARIFTTTFQFRQRIYTALVALQKKHDDLCIQIRFQDEALHDLLPDGPLHLCRCPEQSTFLADQPSMVQELVRSVSEAVEKYLTGHPVAGAA